MLIILDYMQNNIGSLVVKCTVRKQDKQKQSTVDEIILPESEFISWMKQTALLTSKWQSKTT